MPNRTLKGIRYLRGEGRVGSPTIEEGVVASGYGTAIYEGSPVRRVDGGTFEVAAAGTTIYGICCGINQYYDSADGRVKKPLGASPKVLPASTSYTGIDRQSRIAIIPVEGNLFEADADGVLATPTYAGAVALLGSNGDHVVSSDDWALDISNVEANDASPASAQWTLVDLSGSDQDFTASRVKFVIRCNEPQIVPSSTGL